MVNVALKALLNFPNTPKSCTLQQFSSELRTVLSNHSYFLLPHILYGEVKSIIPT